MSELTIRPAGPGDVSAITRIYAETVARETASFEIVPPDAAEMRRRLEALLADGFPWLVALRDGVVAGYVYAGPYHRRTGYRWTVEDSIYVDAPCRGCGVGRALLKQLIAEAEARGFRQMVAVIGDSANAASIALHRAAGFGAVGTLRSVGFKHGRWLDSVLMQRALGEADRVAPESAG